MTLADIFRLTCAEFEFMTGESRHTADLRTKSGEPESRRRLVGSTALWLTGFVSTGLSVKSP